MKETWSLGEAVVTGNVTRRKNAQSHVKLLHAESWQRWLSQCSLRLRFLFSLTLPCVIKNRMGHEMPKNQPDSLPKKTLRGVRVFRSVGSFKPRLSTNKCILDDTPDLDCNESAERGTARGVVQQWRDYMKRRAPLSEAGSQQS